jgi:hypothetical protein
MAELTPRGRLRDKRPAAPLSKRSRRTAAAVEAPPR